MAYLKDKLVSLKKALSSWEKGLKVTYSGIARDACIQRYEYSFELTWKTVKVYLREKEGLICNSPKSCFKAIKMSAGLSEGEVELCLKMCDDRNISVHTYSEKFAKDLYLRTKEYFKICSQIYRKMCA